MSAGDGPMVRPKRGMVLVSIGIAVVVLAGGGFVAYGLLRSPADSALDASAADSTLRPPLPAEAPAPRRVIDVPMYKQWNPSWGDDKLGPTSEPMRNVGCTVSCVAMVFQHYSIEATPKTLNAWLSAHDGYTPRGWLKWEKCVEFSGGRVVMEYNGEPDSARLAASLGKGRPVIVKVMLDGGVQHWVLVVGTEGREFLVNDPLNLTPWPVKLSSLGPRIYAMRIFRKAR